MLSLNVMKRPVDQTWSIERIADEAPSRTWEKVFKDAMPELHDVSTVLDDQERLYGQYYPWKQDIFAAFNYTPLPNVKVVIIGQDPYHQTIVINGAAMPRAVGLSFSVRQEDSIPSSLQNIYTELANTVRGFVRPDHGDLREWARQGVLLLNTCLTVRPGMAGSHDQIWLGFMKKVFTAITTVNPNCIYMLWGREAQKLHHLLGDRNIVLEAAHPSGLSARRGFFGCNHFNLANEALIRQGKVGINWRISTLAELHRAGVEPEAPPPPLPTTGHQPKLSPVDVTMLPTMIPVRTVLRAQPAVKTAPALPVIPNVGTATIVPAIPKIQFGTVATVPPHVIVPGPTIGVPQILVARPPVPTMIPVAGVPQLPQAPKSPLVVKAPGPAAKPIVGLPQIPFIIK
jgi:uracil-DNA glycosylase